MATVNKDFKIKNGLVVEGTLATVNGNDILVENTQATDNYIVNLIGGQAYIKSVSGDFNVDASGKLEISAASDLARTGDISSALIGYATENYVSTALEDYTTTAQLDTTIDNLGYLKSADLTGYATESYVNSQGFITSTALNGYATESYVGNQLLDYTTTSNLDTTVGGYGYLKSAALNGYATESYVGTEISTHAGLTSTHGVTGAIVGTSDQQTLTNKTIADNLTISDGQTFAGTIGATQDGKLAINASQTLYLHSDNANIELVPGQGSSVYINGTSAGNEVATHSYVDNAVSGLDWKQAANLFATSNVALTGTDGTLVIDSHAALTSADNGYRIVLTGQSTGSQNGIYEYNASAGSYTLSRTADADAYAELIGAAIYIMEGTQYGGTSWVQNNHYLTDFTAQTWTQFSGAGSVTAGDGITVDGLEVSVDRTTVDTWYEPSGLVSTHSALTTGVHGVTGNFVGTSDEQTLTNKTLTSPKINENVTLTATATELNILDGATLSTTELNYVDGVTSSIQTQLNSKASAANPTITGSVTLDGSGDFTISSDSNIVLDPNTTAYINSATVGNEIATQSYVDNAVANVTIDLSTAAGANIDWNATTDQFDVNVNDVITNGGIATESYVSSNYVSSTGLDTAVSGLGYAKTVDVPTSTDDLTEGNAQFFTNQRALDAIDGATITPHAVTINTYRKEEATQQYVNSTSTVNVHSLTNGYESAKYLVRVVGTVSGIKHSQLTEILLTVDGNNNIAITEYGTICTNTNNLASFDAALVGGHATLTATTLVSGCEIIAAATMLSWAD